MGIATRIAIVAVIAILIAAGVMMAMRPGMMPRALTVPNPTTQTINRGEYLARAGDCVACHTAPDGKDFAGGRPMPTPFGNLYVPNITPDEETGMGRWTADEFYRMMHTGISRDGTLLYPAMPFASYTKVTREDSDSIYAYLMSVPPVLHLSPGRDTGFAVPGNPGIVPSREFCPTTLHKKNGEFRMVIDYRRLNAQTVKANYPLLLIDG
jgi:mono/diheme cytochrome c family protein